MGQDLHIPQHIISDAALDEMTFWLGIMADHTKIIRNGVDLTEENLFRRSDRFAQRFDSLLANISRYECFRNTREMYRVAGEVIDATSNLADFKLIVAEQIRNCRVLGILPADLLEHTREEAIYFIGKLKRLRHEPTPYRSELGLPNGNTRTLSIPRLLIPSYPELLTEIFYEESLFHIQIHFEHAEVLALFFRPRVQHELVMATVEWMARLKTLYDDVHTAYIACLDYHDLIPGVEAELTLWRDFLACLFIGLVNCTVPTGQINIWPRVIDHMRREADYYLEVLALIKMISNR